MTDYKEGDVRAILAKDGKIYNYVFSKVSHSDLAWKFSTAHNEGVEESKLAKNVQIIAPSTHTDFLMKLASNKSDDAAKINASCTNVKVVEQKPKSTGIKYVDFKKDRFGRMKSGMTSIQTKDEKYIFNYRFNSRIGSWEFSAKDNKAEAAQIVKETTIYKSRFWAQKKVREYEMQLRSNDAIDLTK